MTKEVLVSGTSFWYTESGGGTVKHRAFRRLVPEADTAVLFIHGILGTPDHFRDLIPLEQQIPENWTLCNVLLEGHGTNADAFGAASMEKWRRQVWTAFEELADAHEQVVLVAHSMGTLFALQMAAAYPDKVAFLFLLGVPMRPTLRPCMTRDSLAMVFGWLPEDHVLWKAGSVKLTKKLWKYIPWIPRFLELFQEIYRTEEILPLLNSPCVAYQSRRDELVSNRSRAVLLRSGGIEVCELLSSTHYVYSEEDQDRIIGDFADRIKKISHD